MRLWLGSCALLSTALIGLSAAVCSRSSRDMDWIRIHSSENSVVVTTSRAHIAAALIVDPVLWSTPDADGKPLYYQRFRPADLRRKFPGNVLGFDFREEDGAYYVLAPLWGIAAIGSIPLMTWIALPARKRKAISATAPSGSM